MNSLFHIILQVSFRQILLKKKLKLILSFTTHDSSLDLDFYTYAYIVVQPCKMCDIRNSLFEMFLFRSIISHLHIHVSASRRIHCDVIY